MNRWGPAKVLALVRALVGAGDGLGLGLVGLAGVVMGISVVVPLSPGLERFLVARHQLDAGAVGHWAALPYPSMYSFEHRRYVSTQAFPLPGAQWPRVGEAEFCAAPGVWASANHFGGRWGHMWTGAARHCKVDRLYVEERTEGRFGSYRARRILRVDDAAAWWTREPRP